MVLIKKKKKRLPCGLKIAPNSPSAEWGNGQASGHMGWALLAAGWKGTRAGRQEKESISQLPGFMAPHKPMIILSPCTHIHKVLESERT